MTCVKVTAHLASELSGNAPQLDALLVKVRCRHHVSAGAHERYDPAPDMHLMPPTPIDRELIGDWLVHHVSSPILSMTHSDRHERIAQHFPRERADLLAANEIGTIATTNGPQKSMYLPVRRRLIERVVWFARLHDEPAELRRQLKSIRHIGQDRARGHGRVSRWDVEIIKHDYSWFAKHSQGTVLMRQLPAGDWLPGDLIGYAYDYDAVCPPYWHPGRATEIVRPT